MTKPATSGTAQSGFDFPCPHCGKATPVTMTISGAKPPEVTATSTFIENMDVAEHDQIADDREGK